MKTERSETLERLFEQASRLSGEARAAFLQEVSAENPELQIEVESLLAAAEEAGPFFDALDQMISQAPWGEPSSPDPADEPLAGQSVRQYRIEEKLGAGGMGVVYRAHDTQLDRTVALKFLPPHLGADEGATDRLLVEARAAATLDHPNVCTIYEIGRDDRGRPFIAMAYYDGETLKQKLEQGALSVEAATHYAAQIAAGLATAHAHGIIHRDVKPGNVIVTSEGVAKVLDFGIAKLADVTLTGRGVTAGTVAYMSPEHSRGEELDERTDLWSLGVVLYEMLTGCRPFRGNRQGVVIHAIRHDEPKPPGELVADLPPELEQVVCKLLEKDPSERCGSAEAVLTDLAPYAPQAALLRGSAERPSAAASSEPSFLSELKQNKGVRLKRGVAGVLAITAIVVGAVVGVLAIFPELPGGSKPSLDRNLVAVAVLENRTGDASLDPLGRQAAARLNQAVHQRGIAAVAATDVALAAAEAPERMEGPEAVAALARASGAGIVIHGDYYLVADSLQFQIQITDAAEGEVMSALAPVVAPRERPGEALSLVQERTLGALAAALEFRDGELVLPTQPPSLEAYRLYRQGWDAMDRFELQEAIGYFEQARVMDTTWVAPLLPMALLIMDVRPADADSVLRVAARYLDRMSEPESLYYRGLRFHMDDDDPTARLRNVRRLAAVAPGIGLVWGYWVAWQAYRPLEALGFLARIDTASPRFEVLETQYWDVRARSHHMLGSHEEELAATSKGRDRFPDHMMLLDRHLNALAALGRTAEAEAVLDTVLSLPKTLMYQAYYPNHWRVMNVARELRAHGYPEAADRAFQQGLVWADRRPAEEWEGANKFDYRWAKAHFLYGLGRWREAGELYEQLADEFVRGARQAEQVPEDPWFVEEILPTLACAAARLGDVDRARALSAEVEDRIKVIMDAGWDIEGKVAANLLRGRARIAAVLGEREEAVRLLREGFRVTRHKGAFVRMAHRFRDFDSLHDYLPYQQFLKPRG